MYYVAVRSPDAASAQDTPEEMELDEIPEDQDDDDDDDEKDELASDAEAGVIVSVIPLPRLTGYQSGAGGRRLLTGWPPDSQDGKNLAPWQQKRAESKAKNTARKQRKSKQDTELYAKRKDLEKQKVPFEISAHQK